MQQVEINTLVLSQYIEITTHIRQMKKLFGGYMRQAVVQVLQEMRNKQHIVYIEE